MSSSLHTILVDTILLMFTFQLLNMFMVLFNNLLNSNGDSWLSVIMYNAVSELTQHLNFFYSWAADYYSLTVSFYNVTVYDLHSVPLP